MIFLRAEIFCFLRISVFGSKNLLARTSVTTKFLSVCFLKRLYASSKDSLGCTLTPGNVLTTFRFEIGANCSEKKQLYQYLLILKLKVI